MLSLNHTYNGEVLTLKSQRTANIAPGRFRCFDAESIGFVGEGGEDYTISSPNMPWVPQVSIVNTQQIHMNADGRWGVHELSRWPQIYSGGYVHHCAIPREPRFSDDPLSNHPVWHTITQDDWIILPTERPGFISPTERVFAEHCLGKIKRELVLPIQTLFRSKVKEFESAQPETAKKNASWSELKHDGQNTLERLLNIPQQLWPSVVDFGHAQRCTLCLLGFVTYMLDIRPKIINKTYVADSARWLRGVIVMDEEAGQEFYRVGVPVWQLRRYNAVKSIESIRVRRVGAPVPCNVDNFHWLTENGERLWKQIRAPAESVPDLWSDGVSQQHISNLTRSMNSMKTVYSIIYDPAGLGGKVHVLTDRPDNCSFSIVLAHKMSGAVTKLPLLPAQTTPPFRASSLVPANEESSSSSHACPISAPSSSTPSHLTTSFLPLTAHIGPSSSQKTTSSSKPPVSAMKTRTTQSKVVDTLSFAVKFFIPDGLEGHRDFPEIHTIWITLLDKYSKPSRATAVARFQMPPAHVFSGEKDRLCRYYLSYLRARDNLRRRAYNPSTFTTDFSDKGLSIKEWRTVLIGSYTMSGPIANGAANPTVIALQQALPSPASPVNDTQAEVDVSEKKKRKRGEAANVNNFMAIECGLSPLDDATTTSWNGRNVNVQTLTTQHHIRRAVLWELLESNHRFDVRMLDHDLMPTTTNTPCEELLLLWGVSKDSIDILCPAASSSASTSSVWGPPCKTMTAASRWVRLVARWPGCPQRLIDASSGDVWGEQASKDYLRMALEFYVSEFTSKYSRLPTPPPCNVDA